MPSLPETVPVTEVPLAAARAELFRGKEWPAAAPFSSPAWLEATADAFGFRCSYLAAPLRGDAALAIPLCCRRRLGLRIVPPLPVALYYGIATDAPDAQRRSPEYLVALAGLLERIERQYHLVSLSLPHEASESEHFAARGWELHGRITICIDTGDMDAVRAAYSQSLRRKLRRADEQGFRLVETGDAEALLALHEQSYARHGIRPPLPVAALAPWLRMLRDRGLIRIVAAQLPDGSTPAIRAVVRWGDTVYDWLAGNDAALAGFPASHWLVDAIIRDASASGARRFDFMGANTPGVSDFKRSFGGRTVPYCTAVYRRSRLVAALESVRNRARVRRRGLQ